MNIKNMYMAMAVATAIALPTALSTSQAAAQNGVVYTDASAFPVFGKATANTSARYERLPAEYESISREGVWYLGRNSAGLYVRFRSNSTSISARWTSTFNYWMPHMAPVGTKGVDLYTLMDDGQWRFIGSGKPAYDGKSEAKLIGNMEAKEREYMLYLSLYDGVSSLEIGVDEGASLDVPAVDLPRSGSPIVMYGTSILQGGCVSRPGMAHTNIIERHFNREVINLGFSGNAMLDMEIARLMASVEDPAVYVFDYVPNAWDYLIREKGEEFFRIVRDAHPTTPIIFVEDPYFAHCDFDSEIMKEVVNKNIAAKELFAKLKKQGEKNIYYIPADNLMTPDNECTVDCLHYTDYGSKHLAAQMIPVIKKALKKNGKL